MSSTAFTQSLLKSLSGWFICLFIFSSCSDKPRKDFNLTIVVSDVLGGDENAPLPDEIIALCMPLQACEQHNFVPNPVLHRLGFGPDKELSLETKIEGGFAGNENNVKLITREINSHLSSLTVGETFSQPDPNVDLQASLQEFKSSMAVNTIPVYFSSRGTAYATEDGDRIYTSIDSVRMAIVNQLCQSSGYHVVVFYELPSEDGYSPDEPDTDMNQMRGKMTMYEAVRVKAVEDDCPAPYGKAHPDGFHAIVQCHYGSVFFIRTKANYPSTFDRANNIANKLNEAMDALGHGKGFIDIEAKGEKPVLFFNTKGGTRFPLVAVENADIYGYRIRSCGGTKANPSQKVTAFQVAELWRDVLMDHIDIMCRGWKPARTLDTNCGKALMKLYDCAKSKHTREGMIPRAIFNECANMLDSESKEHLVSVARKIPDERCPKLH
jgi:hypothetical protein